jgi:hypothetical protein
MISGYGRLVKERRENGERERDGDVYCVSTQCFRNEISKKISGN